MKDVNMLFSINQSCNTINEVQTKVLDEKTSNTGKIVSANEVWTVKGCGKSGRYDIRLNANPSGATNISVRLSQPTTKKWAPFSVAGEQLDIPPPKGWKLAWMEGKPDGSFLVEYIPEDEDINSWREGYLAVERFDYPPVNILKDLAKNKIETTDVALVQFIEKVKENCGETYEKMSQGSKTFNGVHFAVGGGYCDKNFSIAPFGEGAFVAFVEGKNYVFRIQYGWRPISAQEQSNNVPWRISPQKAKEYLEAITASTLCGGVSQPVCKNSYAP